MKPGQTVYCVASTGSRAALQVVEKGLAVEARLGDDSVKTTLVDAIMWALNIEKNWRGSYTRDTIYLIKGTVTEQGTVLMHRVAGKWAGPESLTSLLNMLKTLIRF